MSEWPVSMAGGGTEMAVLTEADAQPQGEREPSAAGAGKAAARRQVRSHQREDVPLCRQANLPVQPEARQGGSNAPPGTDARPERIGAPTEPNPSAHGGDVQLGAGSIPAGSTADEDGMVPPEPADNTKEVRRESLEGSHTTGAPSSGAPPATLALTHPEPKRRRAKAPSKPDHWPPTPEAEQAIRRILDALGDARKAAGWDPMRLRAGTDLVRKRHGHLAMRLHELTHERGAVEAERVLVAVYQAKVARDVREGGDAADGTWANAVTPMRDGSWDRSLAAGLAWLASGGRTAAATTKDKRGAIAPKAEVSW